MALTYILHWAPDSLYNISITGIVNNYSLFQRELRTFPENVLFDIFYKLYKQGRLCQLGFELSHLDVFSRVLKVQDKRHLLNHCVQALMDHGARTTGFLADSFKQHCRIIKSSTVEAKLRTITFGLNLAEFLEEAGWFEDCEKVALASFTLCQTLQDSSHLKLSINCCMRLLHSQTSYCKFSEASETFTKALKIVEEIKLSNAPVNLAGIYGSFMAMYFSRSEYNEAYKWSLDTMKELKNNLPKKVVIDILRQATRACVVKREFKRAELLIKQALRLTKENFGEIHPKTADTLLDYGFYLLNIDSIAKSVRVYQTALDIRTTCFGGHNLHIAIAHEDLAYSLYVQEYSSGKFEDARTHSERALQIMGSLLSDNHHLMASSKRVKALILEEMALDNHDKVAEMKLLMESQELHLAALQMSRQAFGEKNVQTAKHYGNLGRLYQSMHRFSEAEAMHLRAIEIKEEILGKEDYEVALSVGHLASLYNYDMLNFQKAEKLYIQSIEIGIKLFGEGYSGLEYDYRGLLRVYLTMGDHDKANTYTQILHTWKQIRDQTAQDADNEGTFMAHTETIHPENILSAFINIQ